MSDTAIELRARAARPPAYHGPTYATCEGHRDVPKLDHAGFCDGECLDRSRIEHDDLGGEV